MKLYLSKYYQLSLVCKSDCRCLKKILIMVPMSELINISLCLQSFCAKFNQDRLLQPHQISNDCNCLFLRNLLRSWSLSSVHINTFPQQARQKYPDSLAPRVTCCTPGGEVSATVSFRHESKAPKITNIVWVEQE